MNELDKQLSILDNHILISNRKGDRCRIGKLGHIGIQSLLVCWVLEEADEIIHGREDEGVDSIGLDKIEEWSHLWSNLFLEFLGIGVKDVVLNPKVRTDAAVSRGGSCYLDIRDAVVLLDHWAGQRSVMGEAARELFLAYALLSLGEDGSAVHLAESHC